MRFEKLRSALATGKPRFSRAGESTAASLLRAAIQQFDLGAEEGRRMNRMIAA
jgi:hypothetical protein